MRSRAPTARSRLTTAAVAGIVVEGAATATATVAAVGTADVAVAAKAAAAAGSGRCRGNALPWAGEAGIRGEEVED